MKAKGLGMLALAVLFAGSLHAIAVGDPSIDFEIKHKWNTLEGAAKLSDYRGKVVLLEVWGTW